MTRTAISAALLISVWSGLSAQERKVPETFLGPEIVSRMTSVSMKPVEKVWVDPSYDRTKGISLFVGQDDWYTGSADLKARTEHQLRLASVIVAGSPYRMDALVIDITEANASRTLGLLTVVGKICEIGTGKVVVAFRHSATLFYSSLPETRGQASSASNYTDEKRNAVLDGYDRIGKDIVQGLFKIEPKQAVFMPISREDAIRSLEGLIDRMVAPYNKALALWEEKKKATGWTNDMMRPIPLFQSWALPDYWRPSIDRSYGPLIKKGLAALECNNPKDIKRFSEELSKWADNLAKRSSANKPSRFVPEDSPEHQFHLYIESANIDSSKNLTEISRQIEFIANQASK